MSETSQTNAYLAFGLVVQSQIELPEALPLLQPSSTDVTVSLTDLRSSVGAEPFGTEVNDQDYLTWNDLAALRVVNGHQIHFDPAPGVDPSVSRMMLLGHAFGAILHQRGTFILHGSAVRVGDGAVGFLAHSGSGKSTLAAAMHHQGCALVADDLLALQATADGFVAHPSFPSYKIDAQAQTALGQTALPALHPRIDERYYEARKHFSSETLPLRAVFLVESGDTFAVEHRSGNDAVTDVLGRSYAFDRWCRSAEEQARHFHRSTDLVESIPVFRFQRPAGLHRLDEAIDHVHKTLDALR